MNSLIWGLFFGLGGSFLKPGAVTFDALGGLGAHLGGRGGSWGLGFLAKSQAVQICFLTVCEFSYSGIVFWVRGVIFEAWGSYF